MTTDIDFSSICRKKFPSTFFPCSLRAFNGPANFVLQKSPRMVSSSSSSSSSWHSTYDVFPSFSGEDVRRTFLSHVHEEFERKGIFTFKDNGIARSRSIGPELERAIRESRIAIVVLSRNYASSGWCLNELLQIMEQSRTSGQTVMTVFHQVDPSDVRKQTGEFGRAFKKTCVGKSSEEKQRWKHALTEVSNIAGEHSEKWESEADMIKKIATDVSKLLNSTLSRDFEDIIGIESHMQKMISLLGLESDEVRFVGIWGPAGIGKTTIARALFDRLSTSFRLSYFMPNVKGTYRRTMLDEYGSKLYLQQHLLSEIFDQKDLRIHHLGVAPERLRRHKVFLVLDDVDRRGQLEALAKNPQWFGSGSRIIVTTENKQLLRAHWINHIYQVPFPSSSEALQIFSQHAFGQSSPPYGFYDIAVHVTQLVGDLPLGLSVLGSSLRGRPKDEWDHALRRLGSSSLDCEIEEVLRVGFDCLSGNDKSIFLHIACQFDYRHVDFISDMLENSDLDVEFGLNVLAERSLIHIRSDGYVEMHKLLRQMGEEIIRRQSRDDPGKRQFLWDAADIFDVLSNETTAESVLGISLDVSELAYRRRISSKAFESIPNAQFINIYDDERSGYLWFPEGLSYLPGKLRLLDWIECPLKTLPPTFCPTFLVEIDLVLSDIVKLWDGIQPLGNLKRMNLRRSYNLKEIPDLSKATHLKTLLLSYCKSLVTLHSSLGGLRELEHLDVRGCISLKGIPAGLNPKRFLIQDTSICV